jgi:hypothetical protein
MFDVHRPNQAMQICRVKSEQFGGFGVIAVCLV